MDIKSIFSLKDERYTDINCTNGEGYLRNFLNGDNMILFPGLVNSHDHLDFNCFPSYSTGLFRNYREWGRSVQENFREDIAHVKKIPFSTRYKWGLYKNLLNGITTVVEHGNVNQGYGAVIGEVNEKQDIHSVAFEKSWRLRLNNILRRNQTVVVHAGEGVDKNSTAEIDSLLRWNLLKRNIIAVHGLNMNIEQAKHFKALVWCPGSNQFLFGSQPCINEMKHSTTILFGTDSTLTGSWSIWDHLRIARQTGLMSDREIFDSLTINASSAWKLSSMSVAIESNYVIARRNSIQDPWDSFFSLRPEDIMLVIHDNKIKLVDEELVHTDPGPLFERISVGASNKFVVKGIYEVEEMIMHYCPETLLPFQSLSDTINVS